MTGAYSVFANEGVRNNPFSILEVKDASGTTLEQWSASPREVLPRDIALKISDVLSDNVARAPAYGQTSFLYFPNQDVAVKTGTTNDYRDAWIIGYTPNVTLGAWAGNNNNTPMEKKVAGFIVAPMWREYMDQIVKTLPNESFPAPEKDDSFSLKPVLRGKWQGGISNLVDTVSGKIATQYTPKETTNEILSGGIHSILYWLKKDDPRGDKPDNPQSDPQFKYWEYGVNKWLQDNAVTQNNTPPSLPQGTDDIHVPENFPKPTITAPVKGSSFSPSDKISTAITSQGKFPIKKVEYFVNGSFVGDSTNQPFSIAFSPQDFPFISSSNTLKAVVTDSVFNKGESETNFEVISP
jgi:membrane peptidoglycan carboxypeptidase